MANVLVQESSLQAIAADIRQQNGSQNTYTPAQMAPAIAAISGGPDPESKSENYALPTCQVFHLWKQQSRSAFICTTGQYGIC